MENEEKKEEDEEEVFAWEDISPDDILGLEGPEHEIITKSWDGDKSFVVRMVREEDLPGLMLMMKGLGENALGLSDLKFYLKHSTHPLCSVLWHEDSPEARKNQEFMGLAVQNFGEREDLLPEGEEVTPRMVFFSKWIKHPMYTPKRDIVLKAFNKMPFHQIWSQKWNIGINSSNCRLKTSFFDDSIQPCLIDYMHVLAESLMKYTGTPPYLLDRVDPKQIFADLEIKPITKDNIDEILDYDGKVFELFERREWMRDWILNDDNHPFAAYDNGELVGFGVLREHLETFTIEPLYADTHEIANRLMVELLKIANDSKKPTIVLVHQKKKEFMDFLDLTLKWKMQWQLRDYSIQAVELQWLKVFGMHRDWHL